MSETSSPVVSKDYNLQTFHVVLVLFVLIVMLLHADGNKWVTGIFNRNNKWTKWVIVTLVGTILAFHGYRAFTTNFKTKRMIINLWHVFVTAVIIAVTLKYQDQAYNLVALFTSMALASQVFLVLYKANQKNSN